MDSSRHWGCWGFKQWKFNSSVKRFYQVYIFHPSSKVWVSRISISSKGIRCDLHFRKNGTSPNKVSISSMSPVPVICFWKRSDQKRGIGCNIPSRSDCDHAKYNFWLYHGQSWNCHWCWYENWIISHHVYQCRNVTRRLSSRVQVSLSYFDLTWSKYRLFQNEVLYANRFLIIPVYHINYVLTTQF